MLSALQGVVVSPSPLCRSRLWNTPCGAIPSLIGPERTLPEESIIFLVHDNLASVLLAPVTLHVPLAHTFESFLSDALSRRWAGLNEFRFRVYRYLQAPADCGTCVV